MSRCRVTATAVSVVVSFAIVSSGATSASAITIPTASPSVKGLSLVQAAALNTDDDQVVMIDAVPADYAVAALALPPGLTQALARDVDLTGAEWLAQSAAANAGADVVAQLGERIEIVDARLEGYELVVTVESTKDARLVEAVGGVARMGMASDRGVDFIPGLTQAADLRGGTPYIFPTAAGTSRCSVGFVGIDSSTRQVQMLSAGHCQGTAGSTRQAATSTTPTISGGTVGSPYTTIGNAGLHVSGAYGNPGYTDETYYDLGLTPVTTSGWVPKPEIVTWGGSSTGTPLASAPISIRDAGPAIAGATVCKSGATTGWTCGAITDVDTVLPVGGSSCSDASPAYCVGGIVANICVRPGDSGGPATVGSRAVGITSASSVSSGACSLGGIGVFATLYSAAPQFEQVTKIWPSWEPLIAVSTPTVTVTGSTFSGSVPQGSARHSIELTFSTGEVLTSAVSSAGAWSIDASGTDPLTKTWSLVAKWGSASTSAPVTGFLLGSDALSEPMSLVATANTAAALTLEWSEPEQDSGMPVTDYVVQFKRSTSSSWSTVADGVSTVRSFTFIKPSAGVTFNFRVQAKNAYGVGPFSSVLTVTTPTATPSAPISLSAPVNDFSSLQLTWDAPASVGAGAVTDYVVQFKRSTSSSWSTVADGVSATRSFTFVRPSAGVTFNFRVQAKNAFGVGPFSTALTVTTPV